MFDLTLTTAEADAALSEAERNARSERMALRDLLDTDPDPDALDATYAQVAVAQERVTYLRGALGR